MELFLDIFTSIGFIIFAITSFWNSSFDPTVSYNELVIPRYIQGIGIAFFFTPLISIIISGLPTNKIASALGLANFLRIIAGSFGTSLSVTIWDRREAFHHHHLVENINSYNPIAEQFMRKLHQLHITGLKAYAVLTRIITNQAYMLSTNDFFWLSGIVFSSLLIIVWFTRPPFITSRGKETIAE